MSGNTWKLRHLSWDICLSVSAHLALYICIYTYIRTARSWRIFLICSVYSLSHLRWCFPKPEGKLEAKARRSLFTEMWQKRPMGWLRVVGSFKLQVSFAKEPYKRDYILQKRPVILKSLRIVATPYKLELELCLEFWNKMSLQVG